MRALCKLRHHFFDSFCFHFNLELGYNETFDRPPPSIHSKCFCCCEREEEKKQLQYFCEQFETQKRAFQQQRRQKAKSKKSLARRKRSLVQKERRLFRSAEAKAIFHVEKQFSDSFISDLFLFSNFFCVSFVFFKNKKVLQVADIFLLVHFLWLRLVLGRGKTKRN